MPPSDPSPLSAALGRIPSAEKGMFNLATGTSIKQITDGTSKTYFCGEKYLDPNKFEDFLDPDTGNNETWCTGHNNDNFRTTASPPRQDLAGYEDGNIFGSAHSSVWNVAFCDGHVEGMSYDIDPQVHKNFGNRKDGN